MAENCSGIYEIINSINTKSYIGSSKNLKQRRDIHFSLLRNNKHPNKHLQRACNKYGLEVFKFEILEECEIDSLIEKEQHYLDTLKPQYNKRIIAESNLGRTYIMKEEHKYKIGINKRRLSDEDISNIVKLRKEGLLMRDIGKIYNVNIGCISRILNGKFYRGLVNKEDFNNRKNFR